MSLQLGLRILMRSHQLLLAGLVGDWVWESYLSMPTSDDVHLYWDKGTLKSDAASLCAL